MTNNTRKLAAHPDFVETRAFDYNGILGITSSGIVWFVNDLDAYVVSSHLWKRGDGPSNRLAPGTKVECNGYPGTIVRHYSGSMYEVRVPGGVVASSDFTVVGL